jgi:hypothetical protein
VRKIGTSAHSSVPGLIPLDDYTAPDKSPSHPFEVMLHFSEEGINQEFGGTNVGSLLVPVVSGAIAQVFHQHVTNQCNDNSDEKVFPCKYIV